MADISKITLPNGNDYNFKDATARSDITTLSNRVADVEELQIFTDPNNDGNIIVAFMGVTTNADSTSY